MNNFLENLNEKKRKHKYDGEGKFPICEKSFVGGAFGFIDDLAPSDEVSSKQ